MFFFGSIDLICHFSYCKPDSDFFLCHPDPGDLEASCVLALYDVGEKASTTSYQVCCPEINLAGQPRKQFSQIRPRKSSTLSLFDIQNKTKLFVWHTDLRNLGQGQ